MLRLRVERTPQAACPVERVARQIVAVRRAKQRGANSSAPCRLGAAQLGPDAARGEPVAGIVERIGVLEGQWVVAVELGAAGKGEGRGANANVRAKGECSPQASRQVPVAVLVALGGAEAVDSRRALP